MTLGQCLGGLQPHLQCGRFRRGRAGRGNLHRRDDPSGFRRACRVPSVCARARQRRLSRWAESETVLISLLRQPPAEPGGERLGVKDRSVADAFLYLFRREHDRIDVFVRVLVLRMRRF